MVALFICNQWKDWKVCKILNVDRTPPFFMYDFWLYLYVCDSFIFHLQILIFISSRVSGDIIYSVRYNLPNIHLVPWYNNRRTAKRASSLNRRQTNNPVSVFSDSPQLHSTEWADVGGTNLVELNEIWDNDNIKNIYNKI